MNSVVIDDCLKDAHDSMWLYRIVSTCWWRLTDLDTVFVLDKVDLKSMVDMEMAHPQAAGECWARNEESLRSAAFVDCVADIAVVEVDNFVMKHCCNLEERRVVDSWSGSGNRDNLNEVLIPP